MTTKVLLTMENRDRYLWQYLISFFFMNLPEGNDGQALCNVFAVFQLPIYFHYFYPCFRMERFSIGVILMWTLSISTGSLYNGIRSQQKAICKGI